MKRKFFISQYLQEQHSNSGIGFTDAEKILLWHGFEPITFPDHYSFSLRAKINRLFFLFRGFRRVKPEAVVVFTYPFYATLDKLLVRWLLSKQKVYVVCFIMDIDGLKDRDEKLLKKEIRFFRRINYFIVLNDKMREWLQDRVHFEYASKIDFHNLLTGAVSIAREKSFDIVFAGDLGNRPFLERLHELQPKCAQLRFHLYGPGKTPSMINQVNVVYHGTERPYELPSKLQGSFGLVWEGDNVEISSGGLSSYIQYISHHKISLYILSGLPIIIANHAATTPLIEKYNIGFAIESLYDIEERIRSVSPEQYAQMRSNMQPLAEKISKGQFLSEAIDELMQVI